MVGRGRRRSRRSIGPDDRGGHYTAPSRERLADLLLRTAPDYRISIRLPRRSIEVRCVLRLLGQSAGHPHHCNGQDTQAPAADKRHYHPPNRNHRPTPVFPWFRNCRNNRAPAARPESALFPTDSKILVAYNVFRSTQKKARQWPGLVDSWSGNLQLQFKRLRNFGPGPTVTSVKNSTYWEGCKVEFVPCAGFVAIDNPCRHPVRRAGGAPLCDHVGYVEAPDARKSRRAPGRNRSCGPTYAIVIIMR